MLRKSLSLVKGLIKFQFGSSNALVQLQNIPLLKRKNDEILIKHWWSERPFDNKQPLVVPIFNFINGEFQNQGVELDQNIFNVPLRRDVVHSVHLWRQVYKKIQTHITRNKATTAGSGKKPMRQKGNGMARQGNKRAPGRKKGGKVHGPQPRDLSFKIPNKKKILAIKTLLSGRLAEGKLRIVDSEKIEQGKTRIVKNILDQYDDTLILFIGSYQMDANFLKAQANLKQIKVTMPHELDINDLLKRRVIITVEGLKQLTQHINDQKLKNYRLRNQKPLESVEMREEKKVQQLEIPVYDPSKPLKLKSKILQEYLQNYEQQRIKENENQNDEQNLEKKEQ